MRKQSRETTEFLRALGATIRTIRKERGLFQSHLGDLAGTAGSRIGEIERGQVNASSARIAAVAGALGMTPVALMKRVEATGRDEGATAAVRAGIIAAVRKLDAADLDLVGALVERLGR